ncbi:MAG: DUF2791 family P-loop domain-containing protein [Thermoplasmata archaeon]|nr:DUF2791 family P-loop domain-containing protein [Thermoplasmata archaeon]
MKPSFVGRERELAQVSAAIEQAKRGKGKMFFVTGEPGIGKTRFLEEVSRIACEKGLVTLTSACIGENAVPYLAIEDALRTSSVIEPSESVPLGLSPVSVGLPQISENEYTSGKTRILEKYLRRFDEISSRNPGILLIDDLQWADTGTLSFLHYLSRSIAAMHLVCICAYVDGQGEVNETMKTVQNINIERNCTILHLGPLSIDAVGKILADMLGTWKISERCVAEIYERCGGNPLYAEEICKVIVSQNLFDMEKHDLKATITQFQIPETVRSLISYRLMKLEEGTLKVLKTGAIIGRVFDYALLEGLSDVKGEALLEAIEKLLSEGFLREEPGAEEKYRFTQNLMYEIVYSEISTPRKRVLHKRTAELLEKTYADSPKFSPEIGRHYLEAGVYDKAAHYFYTAAEYAFKHYALEECITYAKNAVECLGKGDKAAYKDLLFNLQVTMGKALTFLSRFDEAIVALEQSIEFAPDRKAEAEVKLLLCEPYQGKGNVDRAMEIVNDARNIVDSLEDRKLLVKALLGVGWMYERMGSYTEAVLNYEKACTLVQNLNDEKLLADVYHRFGTVLIFKADLERAREYLEKALRTREKYGEKELIASTYNNLAIAVDYMGDIDGSLDYYIRAKKIYEEIGDVRGVGTVYNNIGGIYLIKGETEKAMDFYEKYLQISMKIGDPNSMCIAYLNIGWTLKEEKEYDKALEYLEKTKELAEKTKDKDMIALALCYIAETLAAKGRFEEAIETAKHAREVAMQTGSGELEGHVESTYGRIYKFGGNLEKAMDYFEKAISVFSSLEMPQDVNSNRVELGEVYMSLGKGSEAVVVLKEARNYYDKIRAKRMLERIEKILGCVG